MRDHVLLYINGRRQQVGGSDCFLSLSDFLRLRLGMVGTKIVCSEGDCGSCTVLIGRAAGARFDYRPVDSCIQRIFQLDATHVVTIEGLGSNGQLTPVQEAMVQCHGSQCGFCTPGFVVAMTGLLEEREQACEEDWRHGLTGNLCRCTGYVPILEAGREVHADEVRRVNEIYPPAAMLRRLGSRRRRRDRGRVEQGAYRMPRFFGPISLAGTIAVLKDQPNAKIVAGATDVGVQLNKGVIDPDVYLDLNRVAELRGAKLESNATGDVLVAGARATWTEIAALCEESVPEFYQIVSVFGSPQIRHVGTIGGNIINASPIADSLPFLFVAEAELELSSASGRRAVPITEFYQGYKKFDLRPGELLSGLSVPLPCPGDLLRLFKVSRRRDLDISTFTAAIWLRLDGETIAEARVAFGAVGPTVIRARRTEEFLRGKAFDETTMRAAGDVAVSEVTPISDVRGSADYRLQLTRNVLLKFYHEQALAAV